MTDLISRQDAIALLEAMYRASPWNVGLAEAVEAVTNMPSEALREGDNLYIGRPQPEPPFTVKLDLDKLP